MKGTNRIKLLSVFLIAAYLLSACSGAAPQSGSPVSGGKSQAKEVAFTGTVESVSAGEITVSGQVVAIDAKTVLDPNIKVGDIVKVEAQVSDTGAVTALKIESSGADDTTTDPGNANDTNTNADATNTNDNTTTGNDNINSNSNSNDNSNGVGVAEQEIVGVVEAISVDSVTVGGVVYSFAAFTEFKTPILVGDSVKLHLIVNADGTLTVREIEKTSGASIGDDNSNDNGNSNDDNGNDDNGNDDGDDDNSNSNSNDDNGNDDNSNGGSNSNGNSNGG